ncbi:MAG: GAF domain-containing protein [Anaerolineae bacterium]|nr:GAF domain-containing protein [Anaerolineae bacterium]MDH7474112.1 GAF domain-containing protein [Anaerolineae bacterium]
MEFDQALLEIFGELDRDRLMERVVRYARDRVDASGSSVFLLDDIAGTYVLQATTGLQDATEATPERRIEYRPGEGLTGWIAKHGRALRIDNVMDSQELNRIATDLQWSKKYSEIASKQGRAYLGVPIMSRDGTTVMGVLRVSAKRRGHRFTEADERLLSTIAQMVSIAIENSRRYEQEKRRARYFQLLLDISATLNPRRPLNEMLNEVANRLQRGYRAEACQLYLRDENYTSRLILRAASGLPEELLGRVSYKIGEGLIGYVAESGQPVRARERDETGGQLTDQRDEQTAQLAHFLPSGRYKSFLGIPLVLGDEVHGVLALVNKIPSSPGHRDWFTQDDYEYLALLGTELTAVLESGRYLRALSEVGVTALRMQRIASFGTLAQRVPHETSNPLAVARLALANLRTDIQALGTSRVGRETDTARLLRRLDVIETQIEEVSSKLLNLVHFSQQMGFTHATVQWNDIVREALIWLAAERRRRQVEIRATYGELPSLFIEPNELFGVVVVLLQVMMEGLGPEGGLIEVYTEAVGPAQIVRTKICCPHPRLKQVVAAIVEPPATANQDLSPLHFEWALARQTVEQQYGGTLSWSTSEEGTVCFAMDLPAHKESI